MSRNNDVFQVLVPTSATVAATGSTLDALATGAIGAFSYDTNLAINPAVKPTEDFYLAVKVLDLNGAADINKSSGTHIQIKNQVSYTEKVYTAPVDKVVQLADWTANCDTEYGVRFEIRNQEAYRLNGYNQVVKYYSTTSPDCVDCATDCPDGDCFKVASDLMTLINEDPDAVITASALVSQGSITVTTAETTGGTVTTTIGAVAIVSTLPASQTAAQNAALIAADIVAEGTYGAIVQVAAPTVIEVYGGLVGTGVASAATTASEYASTDVAMAEVAVTSLVGTTGNTSCPKLVFTMNPATFEGFCDINLNYFFPRQTDIVLVGQMGFEGNSTVATTTEMVYEDGAGYDVKQLEYEAGGWNGKPGPYRTYADGLARTGFQYFADTAKNYDVFHASYDQVSVSGWRQDSHFERTVIAAESGGVSAGVKAFLDVMFS